MNLIRRIKERWFPRQNPLSDPRESKTTMTGGRRKGENDNPWLAARRTWNDHMAAVVSARRNWQIIGILSLLIALSAIGGIIHIGSQSKFVPYVIEVDKIGQAVAVTPVYRADAADTRVIHATIAAFISDARMVTPDIALQRQAIFRLYAHLNASDPATARMNEWLNGTEDSNPFKRAEKITASIEIISVLPQTPDTWQVDWTETIRDRNGIRQDAFRMRALVTVYTVPANNSTTEEQIRNNPLGIYVREISWSKQI